MNDQFAIYIGREAIITTLKIVAPVLLVGLTVGLTMALIQAVTSVQEQTLTMIPKMFAVITTFLILLPWMLSTMLSFAVPLLDKLYLFAR